MPPSVAANVFQSTHPRGVRHTSRAASPTAWLLFQSTHPRGVRPLPPMVVISPACFNPRTRVGCDSLLSLVVRQLCEFQSTHPRGVRHNAKTTVTFYCWFQSTHPRGVRRHYALPRFRKIFRFQSTHPRGVRLVRTSWDDEAVKFQSTHPRGVRLLTLRVMVMGTVFQSAHPRGVRRGGL